MLARLADEVRITLVRPAGGIVAAGRPLDEMTDPFALEVHRPVQPENPQPGLPALPAYVPREHDVELARVLRAAEGSNGIAVLVAGSSTGKTRGCWEALQLLRAQGRGGACGIRSTLPGPMPRCGSCQASGRAAWCG